MEPTNLSLSFVPETGDLYTWVIAGGILFLIGLALAIWAFRLPLERDKRLRLLAPYGGFIMCIIAMMLIVGNAWQIWKFPTIEIEYPGMRIDGQDLEPLPSRSAWRLERDNSTPASWGASQNILLLQARDGKTYALPQDRYDLPLLIEVFRRNND